MRPRRRIDSIHGRIRTIFPPPDAPVSRVIVRMQGGQKGLFVNSRNLCHKPGRNRARVAATGHNGRRLLSHPLLRAPRCAKRRSHARHQKRRARPQSHGRP